jgi:hypothetical protein
MVYEVSIGMDESNNGGVLEIHTAVFSLYAGDTVQSNSILPKIRSHKNIFNRLRNRAYCFLLFTDLDKSKITKNQRVGVISSSLLEGEIDWQEVENLNFYLDGERTRSELDFMMERVVLRTGMDEKRIKINYGAKFDQRYPVVNLADEMAHYLFRKGVDYVSEHKDRKPLIY